MYSVIVITMSNLAKLEFISLVITGRNYMFWVINIKMYLESMGLTETIKEMNSTSSQDKTKAMIFILTSAQNVNILSAQGYNHPVL